VQVVDGRLILSPSDLNDHVECAHLTTLALEVARETRPHPYVAAAYGDLLRRKGEDHERAYLVKLRADGREVRDVTPPDTWDFATGARLTEEAMRAGADVIYQATFVVGDWRGRADFLERVEGETALGAWGYEPADAKLARAEKPTYLLQLCFYAEGIAAIQGEPPERMHVLLGGGEKRALRYHDFAAYFRRVRQSFERAAREPQPTEPYPVEHCALCEFRQICDERWEAEDHLTLVAGIRRAHVEELRAVGVTTVAALAALPADARVGEVGETALAALRDQAQLQFRRRRTGRIDWHAIPGESDRGFALLPEPSEGDLIFDIEGDPFWEPARGLHFLFGVQDADGVITPASYRAIWAHDRAGERAAFERVIDLFHQRLADDPDMHVYHYGAYEKTAIKELMGVYATREQEVDDLLRRKVFVDLYTVVRQGLRAGVPGYSLKETEKLAAFTRDASVKSGTLAVLEYEQWMERHEPKRLDAIAAYNREDCLATRALRDWLAVNRPSDVQPRGPVVAEEEEHAPNPLRDQLVAGEETGSPRWIIGELLEYHRREARPAWWWFFERCEQMSLDDLVADAESIARLEPVGQPQRVARSLEWRMRFPPQQYKLGVGDAPVDPATKKAAGTIVALDEAAGTLGLRRGPSMAEVALPLALIPPGPFKTIEQRDALARLASSVLAGDGRYQALRDIVERARPRLSTPRESVQVTEPEELCALAASLDGGALFIQGPPGTGKTWTGARLIVELMRHGRRVGVAATSHKAIHNLLKAVGETGFAFDGVKKASGGNDESYYTGTSIVNVDDVADVVASNAPLVAGTAWLFAHHDMDGFVDTLVIDEAGQVSLADALAMGTSARNVILLGDPLQLAQVSQGTHPPGTGESVLEHLLGDAATIPPARGVFLERTRRMHPDVCRFVSEVVYDNRLTGIPEVARQSTSFGTGLRFVPVDHVGNQVASSEEAARVASLLASMRGGSWTSTKGVTAPLSDSDFMVVAPYNAQVRRLRQALDAAGLRGVEAGTVDKFQGREAPVVFYSMATSSADDVPRSLEFLFSRNRLNVAVSRARCLAYVVASPRLLESRARTVEQMRLINALCRFVELASS